MLKTAKLIQNILILSLTTASAFENRYYVVYTNHKEYTKYDETLSPRSRFGAIFAGILFCCCIFCCCCRRSPYHEEETNVTVVIKDERRRNDDQMEMGQY